MIDPVCLFHGKRRSEHEGGRCLFCGICFDTLTPEECWEDAEGQKWDLCVPCGKAEEWALKTQDHPFEGLDKG
jgi:hypothetical protein